MDKNNYSIRSNAHAYFTLSKQTNNSISISQLCTHTRFLCPQNFRVQKFFKKLIVNQKRVFIVKF